VRISFHSGNSQLVRNHKQTVDLKSHVILL